MFTFSPSKPDGANKNSQLAISSDGTPKLEHTYTIEARSGKAVRLEKGQYLTIVNPSGHQVCDFWAFAADDVNEYTSMEHLRTALGSIFPKVGDGITSNLRRDLVTITKDTSPGVHDTLIAACDHARYQELGCEEYHDNCTDNLRQAMIAIGQEAPAVPAPFNIWMNVPIGPDGRTQFAPPVSKPGDYITFRAEVDLIAVMSACPQDITAVNGEGTKPSSLQFCVSPQ